jgi:hypothetical protein
MRLGVYRLTRDRRRVLAPLVVGVQPLGEWARLAGRGDRRVVVVLVVGHRHFAGGAVLGDAVSLVAGEVVAGKVVAGGDSPPSGVAAGSVAGCEG